MLPRAVTARVAYVPGTAFYADGFGTSLHAAVATATPPPSGSGRAYAGWRGVIEPSSSCGRPSAPSGPSHELPRSGYDAPSTDLS